MPTESYGEFGLNGIGARDGDDVPGPSCGPLAWVTASRRSGSGSRARCGSKQHSAVWIKIDFEFFLERTVVSRVCAPLRTACSYLAPTTGSSGLSASGGPVSTPV